jgi:hypothetical protein
MRVASFNASCFFGGKFLDAAVSKTVNPAAGWDVLFSTHLPDFLFVIQYATVENGVAFLAAWA